MTMNKTHAPTPQSAAALARLELGATGVINNAKETT
jgi:hypothetical protein